jgi:hypothetical protein
VIAQHIRCNSLLNEHDPRALLARDKKGRGMALADCHEFDVFNTVLPTPGRARDLQSELAKGIHMAKSSGQSTAKSAPQGAPQGSGSKQATPRPQAATGKSRPQQSPQTDTDVEEDEVYALVSVLYHALRDASASRKYIQDAQTAEDEELVEFFQRCREDDRARAKEAKLLLVARVDEEEDDDDDGGAGRGAAASGEDEEEEDDEEDEA